MTFEKVNTFCLSLGGQIAEVASVDDYWSIKFHLGKSQRGAIINYVHKRCRGKGGWPNVNDTIYTVSKKSFATCPEYRHRRSGP